eukprot:3618078-Rhodomonas_salina.4
MGADSGEEEGSGRDDDSGRRGRGLGCVGGRERGLQSVRVCGVRADPEPSRDYAAGPGWYPGGDQPAKQVDLPHIVLCGHIGQAGIGHVGRLINPPSYAGYGVTGTEVGYGATRKAESSAVVRVEVLRPPLSSYASAMRCPALTWGMVLLVVLARTCTRGTDAAYGTVHRHRVCCYAMSGTDVGYATMPYLVLTSGMLLPGRTTEPRFRIPQTYPTYAGSSWVGSLLSATRVVPHVRY